jgi:hypothetical protein
MGSKFKNFMNYIFKKNEKIFKQQIKWNRNANEKNISPRHSYSINSLGLLLKLLVDQKTNASFWPSNSCSNRTFQEHRILLFVYHIKSIRVVAKQKVLETFQTLQCNKFQTFEILGFVMNFYN